MELVEKFNNKRVKLNKTTERHSKIPGEYEQVVHVWIMNDEGKFLMQKRSLTKKAYPGMWSVTGGAVDAGEEPIDAAYRETKEELGIDLNPDKVEYMMSLKRDCIFLDIFLSKENVNIDDLTIQEEELSDVKWFSKDEIKKFIDDDNMPKSVKKYFDLLCELIDE